MKEICLEPGVKERGSYGWDVIKVFETETLPMYHRIIVIKQQPQ